MAEQKKPQVKKTAESASSNVRVSSAVLARAGERGVPTAVRGRKQTNFVVETRRSPIQKPFPTAILLAFVAVVAVAMYVLSLQIKLDDLTGEISAMETEIVELKEERNALEVRFGSKYDLAEIERIAKVEYGMVNKDTLSKKYISISGEDEIEILVGKKEKADPAPADEEEVLEKDSE